MRRSESSAEFRLACVEATVCTTTRLLSAEDQGATDLQGKDSRAVPNRNRSIPAKGVRLAASGHTPRSSCVQAVKKRPFKYWRQAPIVNVSGDRKNHGKRSPCLGCSLSGPSLSVPNEWQVSFR